MVGVAAASGDGRRLLLTRQKSEARHRRQLRVTTNAVSGQLWSQPLQLQEQRRSAACAARCVCVCVGDWNEGGGGGRQGCRPDPLLGVPDDERLSRTVARCRWRDGSRLDRLGGFQADCHGQTARAALRAGHGGVACEAEAPGNGAAEVRVPGASEKK